MNTRYIVESNKSPAQAVSDFQESAKKHSCGVLHIYNLKETLASKGYDLPNECHILEICNPKQAAEVLTTDIGMNIALPCRISVYQEAGQTRIGMARPTALFSSLSKDESLKRVAEDVEEQSIQIIEEAR